MLVMLVMNVLMFVPHSFMRMFMLVPFSQM